MRIALCLSGQPRTWRHTHESLFAFFEGHEVETFLHTWDEDDSPEREDVLAAYRPVASVFEPRPTFEAEKRLLAGRWPYRPPLSILDMYHSVGASLRLAIERSGHDLIARVRFDSLFEGRWSGEAPPPGALVVPAGYPDPAGCNDQFAIGGAAEMAGYAGVLPWLVDALPHVTGHSFVPEAVLRSYLQTVCGLTVIEAPIAMRLLREHQAGSAFIDVRDDALFHAAKHEAWEAELAEQHPDLLELVDFEHDGRTALCLDRALTAWLDSHEPHDRFQLLEAPWSRRIAAVDAFIAEQSGGIARLDDDSYRGVRLICAMLLQRMRRGEAMCAESFLVHALSANVNDMRKAAQWGEADVRRMEPLAKLIRGLGPLALALDFAPPFEQAPIGLWRET